MNHFIFSLLLFTITPAVFAQSTVTIPTPSAAVATSTTDAPGQLQRFNVKYTGIYEGPTFSEHTHGQSLSGDQYISNRTALQYNFSKQTNIGFQTRFRTIFDSKEGFRATSENHRFYANFKKVASYNIMSLDITTKAILPTAISAHNSTMNGAMELTPALSIAPADSRFSFAYAPQFIQHVFADPSKAHDMGMPGTYLVHNIEGSYQVNGTTSITAGIYPEYYTLSNVQKFTNRSNELDFGVNWDFAQGWSANPYIGTQLNDFSLSNAGKNMEVALVVSGTIL